MLYKSYPSFLCPPDWAEISVLACGRRVSLAESAPGLILCLLHGHIAGPDGWRCNEMKEKGIAPCKHGVSLSMSTTSLSPGIWTLLTNWFCLKACVCVFRDASANNRSLTCLQWEPTAAEHLFVPLNVIAPWPVYLVLFFPHFRYKNQSPEQHTHV